MISFGQILACSLLFIMSMLLIAYSVSQIYFGFCTEKWPTTLGVVRGTGVDSGGINPRSGRLPVVLYEYWVEDKIYHGRNISLIVGGYATETVPKKILGRYPAGTKVTVYYNPRRHDQALLDPGPKSLFVHIAFVVFGFFLAIISIALSRVPGAFSQ